MPCTRRENRAYSSANAARSPLRAAETRGVPIEAVILLCLSHLRDGETRPFLKGQIELTLPAFVDVVGYLYADAAGDGSIAHRMLLVPANNIIAKDRTAALVEHYGAVATDAQATEWLEILEAEFGLPAEETPKTHQEAN